MTSKVLITGVPRTGLPDQGAPPRLEIATFVQDKRQFSLYIQALQEMYSGSDTESFYQIGGIHGLPYIDWNQSPRDGQNGYCVHGTVLFPTWHRPYVVVFEQVINKLAVKIAADYKIDNDQWTKAAIDLRQPFWDWGKEETTIPPPEVISLEKVEIINSDGATVLVDNPFLFYKFKTGQTSTFPSPYQDWDITLRNPTSQDPDATTDVEALKSVLLSAQEQNIYNANRIFSITEWNPFSNHSSGTGSANSLESAHDSIHVQVGQGGHMSSVPVAAFDPIFFLHHCQVDRLLALWYDVHQTWASEPDNEQDLTPFWKAQDAYWASAAIVDGDKTFNYTYPDFFPTPATRTPAAHKVVGDHFVKMFSKSSSQGIGKAPEKVTTEAAPITPHGQTSLEIEVPAGDLDKTILEWTARIRCNEYEVGESFSVFLFLGAVPTNPEQWHTARTFAGAFHAFVNAAPDQCTNCRNRADIDVQGFVYLNAKILKLSGQDSLDPSFVVPYLKSNLNWRVKKVDRTVIEPPSLEVVVIATPLVLPDGAKFPVAGEPKHHHDITYGRPGGSRRPLTGPSLS